MHSIVRALMKLRPEFINGQGRSPLGGLGGHIARLRLHQDKCPRRFHGRDFRWWEGAANIAAAPLPDS